MRAAGTAAAICLASWVGLFLGAGNVGLQRSVAIGPLTLMEQPHAIALAAGLAFVVALSAGFLGSAGRTRPLRLFAFVVMGDAVGALVVAPLAVGELTPLDAPAVFAVLAVLGLQPLAGLAGSFISRAFQPV